MEEEDWGGIMLREEEEEKTAWKVRRKVRRKVRAEKGGGGECLQFYPFCSPSWLPSVDIYPLHPHLPSD